MPLVRYFLFVGGTLLALLLVANAALPTVPLPNTLTSASDLPPVRIHSERKLPERVVFDTSVALPTQAPTVAVVIAEAKPKAAVPPAMAEMSAKARVREAFAQLPPEQDVSKPKLKQMGSQPRQKAVTTAKPRSTHPLMIAQQPRFGFDTW